MKARLITALALPILVACGPGTSPAAGESSTSAAAGASSARPSLASSALIVMVDPASATQGFSASPVQLRFVHEDGTEAARQTLKPGVRVLAAAGSRVFLLEAGGMLKSINAAGNVQELDRLAGDEIYFVPSPDGTQWMWAACCASQTVHLGGVGRNDRVVAQSNQPNRSLQPFEWTSGGAIIAHQAVGIGGYILYLGATGPVDQLDPATGTLTPMHLKSDCSFFDLAVDGSIACAHRSADGSPPSLKVVTTNGHVLTVPVSSDYRQFGDIAFSPDGRFVTLDESPALATTGNGDIGEHYRLELVSTRDGLRRPFGPANVKVRFWLPDGALVLYRPDNVPGALPTTFAVQPDGYLVDLGPARAVGFVTS